MADTPSRFVSPGIFFGTVDPFDFKAVYLPYPGDSAPPVVTLISPPVDAPDFVPTSLVTVRADDDVQLRNCFVWVEYADGSSEVIYRDNEFLTNFAALSSAVYEDGTHRRLTFVIGRGDGNEKFGWPLSPRIYIAPVDRGGNVA
jgi:hypothetical protein